MFTSTEVLNRKMSEKENMRTISIKMFLKYVRCLCAKHFEDLLCDFILPDTTSRSNIGKYFAADQNGEFIPSLVPNSNRTFRWYLSLILHNDTKKNYTKTEEKSSVLETVYRDK